MRVYIAQFQGLNSTHFDPPELKIDFLLFLGTKALLVEKNYIKFQVYLMAIYDKQIREIDFLSLATNFRFCSLLHDIRSQNVRTLTILAS